MQIKIILRFYLTPSYNKVNKGQQMVIQLWGKRNPYSLLVGVKIGYTAMEISGEASQSLKVELPQDPAIALLGYTHRILYPSNEIVAHSCLLPPYSQQ